MSSGRDSFNDPCVTAGDVAGPRYSLIGLIKRPPGVEGVCSSGCVKRLSNVRLLTRADRALRRRHLDHDHRMTERSHVGEREPKLLACP